MISEGNLLKAAQCATTPDASWQNFAAFVNVIYPKLFNCLCSFTRNEHDAEELTQRAITRLSKNLFRAEQIQNVNAWCFGVARNEFLNYRRWLERNPVRVDSGDKIRELLEEMIGNEASADVIEERHDLLEFLSSRISADDFAIMELRADGLTFQEISRILHQPITTIQSKLKAAQAQAEKIYREEISRGEKEFSMQIPILTPFNTFCFTEMEPKQVPWWKRKGVKPAPLPKDFVLRINGLEEAVPLCRYHRICLFLGFQELEAWVVSLPRLDSI
jgi:RNA polymerase sigma-70 factor (ECF subfamily)